MRQNSSVAPVPLSSEPPVTSPTSVPTTPAVPPAPSPSPAPTTVFGTDPAFGSAGLDFAWVYSGGSPT